MCKEKKTLNVVNNIKGTEEELTPKKFLKKYGWG